MITRLQPFLLLLTSLSSHVRAHMEMSNPPPIRSSLDHNVAENKKDYNYKAPLMPSGADFPCKGYQNDRPIRLTATYIPGSNYSMQIAGEASHGGGSCQLSLSYDNGATFKVIKSMIGGCPLSNNYNFQIPEYAPLGSALFAWTWFNEIGNREMYMNCAWVGIKAPSTKRSGSVERREKVKRQLVNQQRWESLPGIWKANIAGLNTCVTTEGIDSVFPNPGPDVLYGGGKTVQKPGAVAGGTCDAVGPVGQAYRNLGDTPAPSFQSGGGSSTVSSQLAGSSTVHYSVSSSQLPLSRSSAPAFAEGASPAASASSSTTYRGGGVFGEAGTSSSSVVPLPSISSTPMSTWWSSAPTTFQTAISDPAVGIQTAAPSIIPSSSPLTPHPQSSTTYTDYNLPPPSSQPAPSPSSSPTSNPIPYIPLPLTPSYLPCVPGSFLCLSPSEFLICDLAPGGLPFRPSTRWVGGPQQVAAGMKCEPYLASMPTEELEGQMGDGAGGVGRGMFRSDRYVRA